MELEGVVHNGVIVPDDAQVLAEGTRVRIEPVIDKPITLSPPAQPTHYDLFREVIGQAADCRKTWPRIIITIFAVDRSNEARLRGRLLLSGLG